MKFNTVIIGGGLAGLVCGIRLAKAGRKCAIVSQGQSALHFWSGSFDLLNHLPDGTPVTSPLEAVAQLVEQAPGHPYARLGAERFASLAEEGSELLRNAGLRLLGDAEQNHYRITPMGTLRPTWLTLADFACTKRADELPWKEIALYNMDGFLDFYPQFIADGFRRLGTECHHHTFHLSALEQLRLNPTEMRSANIARIFDLPKNLDALIAAIRRDSGTCDAVMLPAVIGLSDNDSLSMLEQQIGKPVRLLPTLHLSVPGIRMQQRLQRQFQQAGGLYLLGDTVLRADMDGDRVKCLHTINHDDMPLYADHFVLASGSYFSQGLVATPDKILEPIFDLDVQFEQDRAQWYSEDFFARHDFHSFGIETAEGFRALRGRREVDNLYAIGAGLAGFNAIKEGCGAGVSVLSALEAAQRILSE